MIKLLPKTKRLKELIKLHGDTWILLEEKKAQCFNDIGFYIESLDGKHKRWVKENEIIKSKNCPGLGKI